MTIIAKSQQYEFPSITNTSGNGILRVFESENIPFEVMRVFSVLNSEVGTTRGRHAHKICNQLICCVAGRVKLICDDGIEKVEFDLSPISTGVLVPAGVWAEQLCQEAGSVIVVFCDQKYDKNDYIHNYEEFLANKMENI